MSGCSRGTVYSDHDGFSDYARVNCKKLSCERCGPKRAWRYRNAIAKRAEELGLNKMMTLTLDPAKCPGGDSVAYLRECFSKFRVSLLRRFGKSISYIAVVELQKSGMAHLHVLIGVYIPQNWISEAWQAVGGGRIVDIRQRHIRSVARYLSKYLTKDFLGAVPSKKKRITTSRDIRLFEKCPKQNQWEYSPEKIRHHYAAEKRRALITKVVEDDVGLSSFTVVRTCNIYAHVENSDALHRRLNPAPSR